MNAWVVDATPIWHDKNGKQHNAPSRPVFWDRLTEDGYNTAEIRDADSINGIVIDTDTMKIVQASGYTAERGLFCDLY